MIEYISPQATIIELCPSIVLCSSQFKSTNEDIEYEEW